MLFPFKQIACTNHSPFHGGLEVGEAVLDGLVGDVQRPTDDAEHGVGLLGLHLLRDELVEPTGVDGVVHEAVRLQEADQVLDRGAEVTPDGQLLQCNDHVSEGKKIYICE